jgi:hypothetical protein
MPGVGVLNWRNINSKFSENRWTDLKVEIGSTSHKHSTYARTKHTHIHTLGLSKAYPALWKASAGWQGEK